MKKGNIVTIIDGNYIQEITKEGLKSVNINYGDAEGLRHKIVATDCVFPKECNYQPIMNNTIICGIEGCVKDRLFVVCHKFLQST